MKCYTSISRPLIEYTRRLSDRKRILAALTKRESMAANARLALFSLGAIMVWLAFGRHYIHPGWISIPVAGFVALIIVHDRIIRAMDRVKAGVEYYERAIARVEDRWMGAGVDGTGFAPEDHPYAVDLDIFGRDSLFQLLRGPQTSAGEHTLAEWLCAPAPPGEIRARQAAIKELRNRVDLREELAYQARGIRASVSPGEIVAWGSAPPSSRHSRLLGAAAYTVTLLTIFAGGAAFLGAPAGAIAAALALLLTLHGWTRRHTRAVFALAEGPSRELSVVGQVLARLEQEPFENPYTRAIQSVFTHEHHPASVRVVRLQGLMTMREASLNMMFAPISFLLMWDFHFARTIERWRRLHGPMIGSWLDSVGRLEALCALATYAYEHPADPFPEIQDAGLLFKGEGIGHPLLPDARCVRNDVTLDENQRLLIISGSNMSGKSALLRTVGINAVLAGAGAPVRARSLALSPLRTGATISIHDAIQTGVSRFYAEITRIRALMDITEGDTPLLFLLDEVLNGTNSWDRRAGARAILRSLLNKQAIGLITTHDLAITELASEFAGRAVNQHFEDHMENDRLVFDYRLRPGVVEKSNALALMRAIGLDVE